MNHQEKLIEHEVEIRLQKEILEFKSSELSRSIKHIDGKLNWFLGFFATAIITPIALHFLRVL